MTLRALLAAGLLVLSFSALAQDAAPIQPKDLEGDWLGEGYDCDGPRPPQQIKITVTGRRVLAVKQTGDDCVPAGEWTWDGVITGNQIVGDGQVSSGPRTSIFSIPQKLTVVDRNNIEGGFVSTSLRRKGNEEVKQQGGDIVVIATYLVTGEPVSGDTLYLFREDGTLVGDYGLRHEDGGRFTFKDLPPGNYVARVGDGGPDYDPDAATANVNGLSPGDVREAVVFVHPARVRIRGVIRAVDAQRSKHSIKQAKVVVTPKNRKPIETRTDQDGRFEVMIKGAPESFSFTVTLADKGRLVVNSYKGFGGEVVTFRSKTYPIDRPDQLKFIEFTFAENDVAPDQPDDQRHAFRHAGMYYVNIFEAAEFGEQVLGQKYDHVLPVESDLFSKDRETTAYNSGESRIRVPEAKNQSNVFSEDTPDNREYHEFGHHFHTDSALGGENSRPSRGKGELNHFGVYNKTSTDSVLEGFAEFYALMVKNSSFYRWGGSETNLEDNNITRYVKDGRVPDEEFQVAGLLWDLVDAANEPGDAFALGREGTWKAIRSPDISDVRSLYLHLEQQFGTIDTNPATLTTDLDDLFVLHGFFWDRNRNGKLDGNEPVGYAGGYRKTVDSPSEPRHNREPSPGTAMAITVTGPDGQPIAVRRFAVRIIMADDAATPSYDYETALNEESGTLRLALPAQALRAEITPIAPGYETDPLVIIADRYAELVAGSVAADRDVFLEHDFVLAENGVETPANFVADWSDDQTWLTWDYAGEVALVRGYGGLPDNLSEGEVLSRNRDGYYVETAPDVLAGEPAYYALFGVGPDGRLSRPVTLLVAGPQDETDQQVAVLPGPTWHWWLLAGLLAAAVVVVVIVRRRRRT